MDTSWLFLCLGSRTDCASHSLPVVGWSVSCLTVMCCGTNRHVDNTTQIVPYLKPTRTCDEAAFVEAQPTEKMDNPIVSALATTVYGSVQTPALGFHDFHVIENTTHVCRLPLCGIDMRRILGIWRTSTRRSRFPRATTNLENVSTHSQVFIPHVQHALLVPGLSGSHHLVKLRLSCYLAIRPCQLHSHFIPQTKKKKRNVL